jgi:L-threonylcarbamoyladenylate synthase
LKHHPEIDRAAAVIKSGGLVAFPTETVYGLGANALDPAAVERIFAAKGRPPTSPLIVHVSSVKMARVAVVAAWPDQADILTSRYWPGPLTLVLPKHPWIPDRVTAGLPTVGVRMPAHAVARALIEAAGVPIAAPSANRFTGLSPTTAEHVKNSLPSVDLILDGGPAAVGIESTVLSLVDPARPVLLRPGGVSQRQIEELIGSIEFGFVSQESHPAPGMHPRHYSPVTPLLVTSSPPAGRGVWLYWNESRDELSSRRMPSEPIPYARELYAMLHRLDAEDWEFIAVEPVPDELAWDAIRDRLRRASASTSS